MLAFILLQIKYASLQAKNMQKYCLHPVTNDDRLVSETNYTHFNH